MAAAHGKGMEKALMIGGKKPAGKQKLRGV
jgi:hypothetical protein